MAKGIIEIHEKNLPAAWERSVLECWENGEDFETQYDKEGDPLSKDCTARIIIDEPLSEPRIHKAFPGGLEDLEIYVQEVVHGVHDNWLQKEGNGGDWNYTYHDRIFKYPSDIDGIDQIQLGIDKLIQSQHTRRAQVVVWSPLLDNKDEHCPCLQRMHFRIFEDRLRMNVYFRSNDAYKASFMNMYALIELQKFVANEISKGLGREISVGRYIHHADSYHIYGSYFEEFSKFFAMAKNGPIENRTMSSEDVRYFLDNGKITLYNNTQTDIQLPQHHRDRLYSEIPEDRRSELMAK